MRLNRYEIVSRENVLRRAGLYSTADEEVSLVGQAFHLRLDFDGIEAETVVRVTKEHFDPRTGLWLEVNKPVICDLLVRGIQYVVHQIPLGADAVEEGWYIGLGNDPHGEFVKLRKFSLLNDD